MIKTLTKPRYNPKYKIKSTTETLKLNSSTLPSKLQIFKQNYYMDPVSLKINSL